jgi:hypothetical protein
MSTVTRDAPATGTLRTTRASPAPLLTIWRSAARNAIGREVCTPSVAASGGSSTLRSRADAQ